MATKQTAVEWLVNEITSLNTGFTFGEIVEYAKQMEKEQVIDAFNEPLFSKFQTAEQYYNETFKQT